MEEEIKSSFFNDSFEQIIRNVEIGEPNAVEIFIARIKSSVDDASWINEQGKLVDDLKTEDVSLEKIVSTLNRYVHPEKIKEVLEYKNNVVNYKVGVPAVVSTSEAEDDTVGHVVREAVDTEVEREFIRTHGSTLLFFIRKQKIDLSQYPAVNLIAEGINQSLFSRVLNPPYPRPELHVIQALRLGLDINAVDPLGKTLFRYALAGALMYRGRIKAGEYGRRSQEETALFAKTFFELLFRLVRVWGADVNKKTDGMTPLHFALADKVDPTTKRTTPEDFDVIKALVVDLRANPE